MHIKSISPSRIKTYDTCLYKYYLTYHTKEQMKTNWGAVHGSLLHNILEQYVKGEVTDHLEALYKGYRGEFEYDHFGKRVLMATPLDEAKPKEFAQKKPYCDSCPFKNGSECVISGEGIDELTGCPKMLFENSVKMLEKSMREYKDIWPKVLRDKTGDPIGVEYEFFIPIPGTEVLFKGFADLAVEHDKDTIEIIDYKFGKWTQTQEECDVDIQVRGYSWAARQEFVHDVNNRGFNYKNVILTFDYATNIPITVTYTKEQDDETARQLSEKAQEILGTTDITRLTRWPEDNFKCKYLCDLQVCNRTWNGDFTVKEDHGKNK